MNDTNLSVARESSRHLSTLLRHEQGAMADFLVALADFDRRGLWRELGHSCLFYYLQRELRLSDGAAHFRKVAARLIQRFPEVVEPLREGKLCITSIVELARVMTPENREDALPRFFHMSKRQAKAVAAAILPAAVVPKREVVTVVRPEVLRAELRPDETPPSRLEPEARSAPPMRVEPLTANDSRIHLTVSSQFLEKLEAARRGQGHVQPSATKEQVIEAALDLLLEKQASRRAEVKRPQKKPRPAKAEHVTAAVKRAVWTRDEGKCQWKLDSGGVCGSEVRLEIDHVAPRGRGGPSTVENCRILCRSHNLEAARGVYGEEVLGRYARNPVAGEMCAVYFADGAVGVDVAVRRRAIRPSSTTTATVARSPAHRKACSPGPAGGRPATPSRLPNVAPAQAHAKVMGAIPRSDAPAKAKTLTRLADST